MKYFATRKTIAKWLILLLLILFTSTEAMSVGDAIGTGDICIYIQIVTNIYDFPTYYDVYTDDDNLLDALLGVDLIQAEEGSFGFAVTTVNGRKADENKGEYWQIIYSDKERGGLLLGTGNDPLGTSIEQMPIKNGDYFIFSLENSDEDFTDGLIEALAIDDLATRSGPSTEYRETGSYPLKGDYVTLISVAYDKNDICWVQCEVPYKNTLRRIYTGLKRFDINSFDLDSVPEELPLEYQAKVTATSKAMFGPGDGYGTYDSLTVDKGQTVTIITIENDYAQVEWNTTKQSYRAWVPVRTLSY